MGFPGGSAGNEPACNVGDLGLFPGFGRSPGEGKGYPPHYLTYNMMLVPGTLHSDSVSLYILK